MLSPFFFSGPEKLTDIPPCPLCQSENTDFYHQDNKRRYFQCCQCDLVFVSPEDRPDPVREKREYDLHENHADDPGYQRFLNRLAVPLMAKTDPGSFGLDFGCGPTPLLAELLADAGMNMSVYDAFYFSDKACLSQRFDFITCTEAIEHFHNPISEWRLLHEMLKPGGVMAIMTKRVISKERFCNWHYKNDITHVSFFSEKTFTWLASQYGYDLEIVSPDIVFLHKYS